MPTLARRGIEYTKMRVRLMGESATPEDLRLVAEYARYRALCTEALSPTAIVETLVAEGFAPRDPCSIHRFFGHPHLRRVAEAYLTKVGGSTVFGRKHASAVARKDTAAAEDVAVLAARTSLRQALPKATRRIHAALDDGVDGNGKYREHRGADKAMELVLDATGLTKPEQAAPVIHIDATFIRMQAAKIDEDDEILRAVDVTPVTGE